MEYVLKTESLCKDYGRAHILKSVSLDIPKGSIYGLVGRNGAGKTTLMRIITGLAQPTSGRYVLSGIGSDSRKIGTVRRRMGSLIESPAVYKNMSAYDNLKIQFINLGMTSFDGIDELLSLVELDTTGKKKAGKFSLGMRQRLGIAIALCGNPDILVLDEPINGLDPQGIIQMREILLKINRKKHTTILISSHILDELSRLATHYAFLERGQILKQISSEELMKNVRKASRLTVSSTALLCPALDIEGIEYKIVDDKVIDIFTDMSVSSLAALASSKGVEIEHMTENNESLEGYFMNLIGLKEDIT